MRTVITKTCIVKSHFAGRKFTKVPPSPRLFHGSTALVDLGLFMVEASWSHSDIPHSAALLWTSDQLVAETSA